MNMPAKKKTKRGGGGRGKPKMPKGFKKGQIVRVGRRHGKLDHMRSPVVMCVPCRARVLPE